MGILLILTIFIMLMYLPIYRSNRIWEEKETGKSQLGKRKIVIKSIVPVCWTLFTLLCFYLAIIMASYGTYISDKTFYHSTHEQYVNTLKMYHKYAALDSKGEAMTDLVYKNYQTHIASFIETVRDEVVRYNASIVSKRIMKDNFFYSWFIIPPDDDMVPIKLGDLYKEINFHVVSKASHNKSSINPFIPAFVTNK